ncbi:MAG: hypothetical protein HUK20_06715 [Fibrobacter sp.]|nr:hypothetical protein [Fibrobacter sp.]
MRKFFCLFAFLVTAVALSAPLKSGKDAPRYTSGSASLVGAVESRDLFSGERLFFALDSVGGTGTWMEWDVNGVKDPSVMEVLSPMLKSKNKPKMVWVLTEREGSPLLATLLPKGAGEVLLFYELKSLDAKPEALALNGVLHPDVVLRDYRQVNKSEYVHRDRPDLKVYVTDNVIRFTYEKKGEEPLLADPEFSRKSRAEKQIILRDFQDFFKYEMSLMLRAFVQSTRSIFNWQPWHWYMASWNSKYLLSDGELEAILSTGVTPRFFTLFKAHTAKGETVEFRTNGSGFLELLIKTKN